MSDFSINFNREGTVVRVFIGPTPQTEFVAGRNNFVLDFNCDKEWSAELLRRFFDERLGALMEHERREYYNKGWKDKSSRRITKREDFPRSCRRVRP